MMILFIMFKNRDVWFFDVEDVGDGEFCFIEVLGEFFQFVDCIVVYNCIVYVYEYIMQVFLDLDFKFKGVEKGIVFC